MHSRQRLSLDTSNVGVNQRYSYVETPLEMTPPNQANSRLACAPTVQNTHPTNRALPINIEKAHLVGQNIQGPGIAQHPANHAPFADHTPQRAMEESGSQNIDHPSSPGPLPIKADPYWQGLDYGHQNLPIAPDANPLQSPTIPYFPPPIKSPTAQAPAATEFATSHQPGQISHPNQQIKGGGWSHGLCDFSSIGTCCLGLVCPCILYGKTQHRLSMRSRKEDPTNMLGYETCNGSCTAMALLCGCQWLLATIQHTRTRKAYDIQGSIASDCVRATCCTCCTLIQDEKEIRAREEERAKAARASGAALVSPYLAPVPMSYGPPQR
ncbi:PLAC8 family-domain-containing protein [Aspergillus aurantiobrunneus]